jgi:hypothetical protein
MIIADLVNHSTGETVGRVYLSSPPFPGDTIKSGDTDVMVIRRTFLDLGPDAETASQRLSLTLNVRIA